MSSSSTSSGIRADGQSTSRRALADIQYNSILSADNTTSSEDETPSPYGDSGTDVTTAIGVSIGREQTRLLSPRTPAVEKAAAIGEDGDYFQQVDGAVPEISESPDEGGCQMHRELRGAGDRVEQSTPSPSRPSFPTKAPSPRRNQQAEKDRSSRTKSILRDGFSFGRKRASSGPDDSQKSLFPSFPSLPKSFSVSSHFSSSRDGSKSSRNESQSPCVSRRRSTVSGNAALGTGIHWVGPAATPATTPPGRRSPRELEEAEATVGDLPPRELPLRHVRSRPAVIRRSTSDSSLVMNRTLSAASSLGDDTRFEDVSAQVNSRFKAIKDSLADSRISLPSMPSIPSLSSFNVSKFGPDFLRERSNSGAPKPPDHSNRPGPAFAHGEQSEKPVDPMTRQPYASAKSAMKDASLDKVAAEHPHFNAALDQLEGDIVVLGGYRGSILRSAEPPHRQVWVPIKVGLNLRKVDLEVGIDEGADERATETIIPGGMLTHIGPVDVSRRLLKRLRSCDNARNGKLRVHEYGYDWRLHPLHLSKQLASFLEGLPSNRPGVPHGRRGALVIAHSLGGLITRHVVNQRPSLFSGVIYAGVPTTCVNILGPLRNGDEVLLSDRVLTAQVNFTIRTSFALLPLNGRCFIDKNTKEEYVVDFFDPKTWIEYRLSPCVGRPLPPLSAPPKPTGIAGYVSTVTNALPNFTLPGRKSSKSSADFANKATAARGAAVPPSLDSNVHESDIAAANGNVDTGDHQDDTEDTTNEAPSVRTAVTIPRDDAIAYLTRTLASVKKFKEELAFNEGLQVCNAYPPISVIYGRSTPTVIGAKVDGREGIKHADAYDELAFASGDGVVLARAAMAPEGYRVASGGVVSSGRGHVTLLGDLEAVGKCLNAVMRSRRHGVGMGKQ